MAARPVAEIRPSFLFASCRGMVKAATSPAVSGHACRVRSSRSLLLTILTGLCLTACSNRGAVSSARTTIPAVPSSTGHTVTVTLGRVWGPGGQTGYGEVQPRNIFNGGDPTGLVKDVRWESWGQPRAVGHGTGLFVADNQYVAAGRPEPATVVAFDLGTCRGQQRMYRKITWFFPRYERMDLNAYINICSGEYAP